MRPKRESHYSRRTFLGAVGTTVPTLQLMGRAATAPGRTGAGSRSESSQAFNSEKFTPLDLAPFFNCSPADFGPREQAKSLLGYAGRPGLIRTPAGRQSLRGIPFYLSPGGWDEKGWAVLGTESKPWATRTLQIPLNHNASFVCLAAFCDWDANEHPPLGQDVVEKMGERLAEARLVYSDGSEHIFPIR